MTPHLDPVAAAIEEALADTNYRDMLLDEESAVVYLDDHGLVKVE